MDDEAAVTRVLTDYYEPCLLIGPQGVVAVPTRAAMAAAFAPVMEGLRARGYGRSELSMPHVEQLSATAALASGVAVRYRPTGRNWSGWPSATCCTRPTPTIVGRSR
jgi:hypothetical protein